MCRAGRWLGGFQMTGYMAKMRKLVGHRTVIQCAASIICVDQGGRMLLGRRSDNHKWGYSGGAVEIDEQSEDCARRELLEEMGLIAETLVFFCVNSGPKTHYVYPNGDEVSNFEIVYLCRDWHGTPVPRDGEMEELRFFACDEIDLSEISPPIREVVKQYIQKQPRNFRRQESGEKGLIEALRLRPYKRSDAKSIVSWIENEYGFRQWCADRYDHYPITPDDINAQYDGFADADWFYPVTAFNENGVVGHMIMRFTDDAKETLRLGFIIIDSAKRGHGYGKGMLGLAVRYAFEILKAKTVTLGVFENNPAAYHCYRSAGFREMQTEPGHYRVFGEDWKCLDMIYEPDEMN